jgi:hypothetical protein
MHVDVGRDRLVLECQHALDEAAKASSALRVPNVGFDRADVDAFISTPEHTANRRRFDGISRPRPSTMTLPEVSSRFPRC